MGTISRPGSTKAEGTSEREVLNERSSNAGVVGEQSMLSVMDDRVVAKLAKTFATLFLVKYGLEVLNFLYKIFLRPGLNLKKRYGGWAIVTGCTDGIGKAFCQELAKKGFPLLLVSRTEAELKKEDVEVKYLAVDFGSAPESKWKEVQSVIE